MLFPLLMLVCIGSTIAVDTDSANEVDPKPPIRLDPALRRALLKAIENLENEPELEEGSDTTDSTTTEENEILATGDEVEARNAVTVESITDQEPSIQYHSFVVDGQKAFENVTDTKSKNQEENIESVTYKGLDPILVEDIETKETSFNTLTQTRSIQNNIVAENSVKDVSKVAEVTTKKPAPTTTTTTTTTTPKPKYNEDGENIEELDEVQVFQAPLVAAFTVHQDAQGLPRSVVPIYKQAVRKPITPALPVTRMQLGSQSTKFQSQLGQQQNPIQQAQIIQQLQLQQQLEQKQRLLEEQFQKLQNQQKQHEELLRRQQYVQQQQLLYSQNEQQRQQQILLEEQQKLRQQQQYFDQQKSAQNFVQPNVNNNQFRQQPFQKSTVTFQPSISLPSSINVVEQQLPQREAVDFLVHLRSGQQSPFPLQQQNPQNIPSNQLQLPLEKPFNNNFIDKSRQNSNNVRVFRHDSGTGNFGLNTNNAFINKNFQSNNNFRNIPLTPHHNRYSHDNELQSLLLQSGLAQSGRSQEDLSIVSKVLSLNHGLNYNFGNGNPNFHFGESQRIESKLKPNFNRS